ncbi:hypothetical protein HDU99_002399 [Rhizoclosmatium hyalinum]|nr:hypothetical protein HDU99_002399 [Rhizoclosmatium hyalinum]
MMHLTLEIARDAHGGTRSVCEGLHKLAVATGAPDWEDLTLDDGRLLFARGEKYVLGLGVNKSYDLAWKAYLSAAQCGNASAMNMLGVMSETGMAGNVDMVGAMKWFVISSIKTNLLICMYRETRFSQAAKNDCPEALCNLGRIYETGSSVTQDFSLASTFYLRGAELGNSDAMTSLGWLLENGLGKEKDEGLAVQWYRLAANSGYARAMNSLGGCYYRGVGVDKDYGEAVIWYKKGAELGNAHAQNNLGICYEEGKGVLKDLVLAKTWYKAASDSKHPNATNNLGYMHLIEKNYTEALKLFYLAWALGSADAAYNIGHLYETGCEDNDGIVVEQNTELALRWYRDASEKDSTKAQIRLATLLTTLPNPRLHDAEIAITYLEKAVSTKSADAMCLMGQFLQLGIGTGEEGEPDDAAAVELFSEGAKMGHAGCLYQLGGCYERGVGVERDFEKSMKIFEELSGKRVWLLRSRTTQDAKHKYLFAW